MIEKDFFGESKNIEFKREIPSNHEKFLKDIIAFSNTTGGKVIIGIDDKTQAVYGIGDASIAILFRKIGNVPEKVGNAQGKTVNAVNAFEKYIHSLNEPHLVQNEQDIEQDDEQDVIEAIIAFCSEPRSVKEIVKEFAFPNRLYLKRHYLDKMLINKELKMTLPDKPSSKNQKYYS